MTKHTDTIKIRVNQKVAMTPEGIKQWSHKRRPNLHKFTYRPIFYDTVHIEQFRNREAIQEYAQENLHPGEFVIYTYKPAKTPTKVALMAIAKVTVVTKRDGTNHAILDLKMKTKKGRRTNRMSRYWFWEK